MPAPVVRASACLAAIPEAAAKQATWERMISGAVPDATLRSVLSGFYAADQDELVKPFFGKYFEAVGDIWRHWGQVQGPVLRRTRLSDHGDQRPGS